MGWDWDYLTSLVVVAELYGIQVLELYRRRMSSSPSRAAAGGGKGDPASGSGGGRETYTGKADQNVPFFDNTQKSYREFRKRCDLYKKKMELANRSPETIFNIVTLMTGKAWDTVEDMTVEQLQESGAYAEIFRRLDEVYSQDAMTELPEDFEQFFVKLQRRASQTLQDFQSEFTRAERKLRSTHQIDLPEKVKAWWYLRRSGVTRDQRQLVLTRIGTDGLNLQNVEKAMNFILGQDSKVEGGRFRRDHVLQAEDDCLDEWQEEDGLYWAPDDDDEEQATDQGDCTYLVEGEETPFDPMEYDEIHATYMEAKSKLNMMRTSRGYYPVVAMIQQPGQQGPFRPRASGKGGKNKSKSSPSSPSKGSTAKARGRQALGKQLCLRCGVAGHFARNCPTAGSDKKRKAEDDSQVMMVQTYALDEADDDGLEEITCTAQQDGGAAAVLGSQYHIKRYLRYLLEQGFDIKEVDVFRCHKGFKYGNSECEVTNLCVLLPIFVGGVKAKVMCYVNQGTAPILFGRPMLEQLGLTVDHGAKLMKWPDGDWQPIPLGRRGEYLIHLAEDIAKLVHKEIPFRIFLPTDFKDHVDIENRMPVDMVLDDLNYHQKDNILMSEAIGLVEGPPMARDVEQGIDESVSTPTDEPASPAAGSGADGSPCQAEEPDEGEACESGLQEASSASSPSPVEVGRHHPENYDYNVEDKLYNLKGKQMRNLLHGAQLAVKQQAVLLAESARIPERDKQDRVIWEVFVGRGRTAEYLSKMKGVKVKVFSLQTGWDFTRGEDRVRFLRRLKEEEPDEVMMAPMCRLWSQLQELSCAAYPERKEKLETDRKENHDTILMMCAVAYEYQRRGGRHATLEHPYLSKAWGTDAFKDLPGYSTMVDQCRYGLMLPDDNGVWWPAKKPTRFHTTKYTLFEGLRQACACRQKHQPIEGYVPGYGSRSKMAESYPPRLARRLAQLLAQAPTEEEDIYALDDADNMQSRVGQGQAVVPAVEEELQEDIHIRKNKELRAKVGPRAYAYVQRLHKNLGHPSPDVLMKMLEEVQATAPVLEAAKGYLCPKCYARAQPSGNPPAAGLTAREFNHRLMIDSAWVDTEDGRRCILTIMDQATRYITVRLLKTEQAVDFVKGLERAWIKHFGVPHIVRVDEAKGWASKHVRERASNHGIIVEVSPAESHNWLGAVERKHQVVRRALELYMDDLGKRNERNLNEAAIYVPGQVNNMSFTKGFTPTQWVMGKTPGTQTSLTAEIFNPGIDPMDEQTAFAEVQGRRQRAQVAFIHADNDARLRRAMNRNFQEVGDQCQVGQKIWYWRIAGSGILQKAKWRGPARVVAVEHNDKGHVIVLWVAHGTSLLRCSPRQCRPMVEDAGFKVMADPAAALRDLQELKARSTTQFRDIRIPDDETEPDIQDQMDYEPSILGEGEEATYPPDIESEEEEETPPLPGVVLEMLSKSRELRTSQRQSAVQPSGSQVRTQEDAGLDEGAHDKRRRVEALDEPTTTATSAAHAPPAPAEVPVPEPRDGELLVEDDEILLDSINMVENDDSHLPQGWKIIGDFLELDEIYVNRELAKRKSEVSERKLNVEEREKFIQAKRQELEVYFRNGVWEFAAPHVVNKGRVITARWVLTWKPIEGTDQFKAKARLVLRGFEDPDLTTLTTAAPTANRLSKMMMLMMIPNHDWRLYCGDVRAAFLSGKEFTRKLIVKLPKDCGPLLGFPSTNEVHMTMNKSAYGLADAPLLWFQEASSRLRKVPTVEHPLDKCCYLIYNQEVLTGMCIIHVDDLLIAGDNKDPIFNQAVDNIKRSFDFGKWIVLTKEDSVLYCGGRIKEGDGKKVTLDYEDYTKKVIPLTIPKQREQVAKVNEREISKIRALIGALQWPAGQGCPWLNASVSLQAGRVSDADVNLMIDLNKTLRFAKENASIALTMHSLISKGDDICFICFTDAALAVRADLASQGGYLIVATSNAVLRGETVPYSVVSWRSFKLPRVARSSLAAEAQACAVGLDELLMVKAFYAYMKEPRRGIKEYDKMIGEQPCAIVTDAKALYDSVRRESIQSSLDKRAALEILGIKESIRTMNAQWRWVSSERQLADGLTKLASRQDMADILKGGYVKLVHDPEFKAAKRKTKEQKLESKQVRGNINGATTDENQAEKTTHKGKGKARGKGRGGKGSAATILGAATAMAAATGVEGSNVSAVGTAGMEAFCLPYAVFFEEYFFEIIFFMMITAMMMATAWCSTSWSRRRLATMAEKIDKLEQDLQHAEARLKLARDDALYFENELASVTYDYENMRGRRYFITPSGKRIHVSPTCPHMRDKRAEMTMCRTCAPWG